MISVPTKSAKTMFSADIWPVFFIRDGMLRMQGVYIINYSPSSLRVDMNVDIVFHVVGGNRYANSRIRTPTCIQGPSPR